VSTCHNLAAKEGLWKAKFSRIAGLAILIRVVLKDATISRVRTGAKSARSITVCSARITQQGGNMSARHRFVGGRCPPRKYRSHITGRPRHCLMKPDSGSCLNVQARSTTICRHCKAKTITVMAKEVPERRRIGGLRTVTSYGSRAERPRSRFGW